jgi:hypothetical protein
MRGYSRLAPRRVFPFVEEPIAVAQMPSNKSGRRSSKVPKRPSKPIYADKS